MMMASVRSSWMGGASSEKSARSKSFSKPLPPTNEAKASATTTVGSTKGRVASDSSSDLAGKS